MQTRRAARQQPFAQLRHHVQPESLQRRAVVAVAGQLQPYPARDLGAAHVGEALQLGVVGDGHDAGDDRDVHAQFPGVVDEAEIGVSVVEILGDGGVRAGVHLAGEMAQVFLGGLRLRMDFRVGGGLDMEPVAGFGADEFDELAGVGEFAGRCVEHAVAAGQVAAQGNQATDAVRLVFGQHRAQLVAVAAYAGQVRRGFMAFGADFEHRVARAGLG